MQGVREKEYIVNRSTRDPQSQLENGEISTAIRAMGTAGPDRRKIAAGAGET